MRNVYSIRKKKKFNVKRLLLLALFLCIIAVMPLTYSSFFALEKIEVEGNKNISTSEILEALNCFYGENLLMIKKEAVKNAVTDILPISDVNVKYKYPRCLLVTVKERDIAAALPFSNKFALIDVDGIVVKIVPKLENMTIPIVTGFNIYNCQVARLPSIETKINSYYKLKDLLKAIKLISSELSEIHVTDGEDTKFYLYTLDGYQVAIKDCSEQKINLLAKILKDLRKNNRGKGLIDITNDTPFFTLFQAHRGEEVLQ
jgi:cell division protein FtsQ